MEASTENNIVLKQGNRALLSIEYGKQLCYKTIVSGSQNYTGILNFRNCYTAYNLTIILSDSMRSHAIIIQGNEHYSEPHTVALKNPYRNGNVTFMFGGEYSNQTVGRIAAKNYSRLVSPGEANINNFKVERKNTIPYQAYGSYMAFLDSNLNSIIYLDGSMSIISYNYYNSNIFSPYAIKINSVSESVNYRCVEL